MNIDRDVVKDLQIFLNKQYGFNLVVDGDPGKNTMKAVNALPLGIDTSDKERLLTAAIQHAAVMEGLNPGPIDGYWGPQTDYAYDLLHKKLHNESIKPWRDDEGIGLEPVENTWPPQTQEELIKFYGQPGENQTKVTSPYPLKIAWNTDKIINSFSCHEKVADSISRVLTRVLDFYGPDQITALGLDLWGGCLNVRKMRGGTKWSTHSWGIAIDWDPAHNRLRWHKNRARFARPEYGPWWGFWEREGWVSLGRTRDYDWMHVQAARVRK